MPTKRQLQGTQFETEVSAHLESLSYKILALNLRVPVTTERRFARAWIEIDIFAEDPKGCLWLIEAKNHRNAASSGLPILSRSQRLRLLWALSALRLQHPGRQVLWALAWRKASGAVEFAENPCYF